MKKDKVSTGNVIIPQTITQQPEPVKNTIVVSYIRPDNERVKKLIEKEKKDKDEKERQKQTEVIFF